MILEEIRQSSGQRIIATICTFLLWACTLFFLNACSSEPDVPLTAEIHEIAMNGYDPVSYFNERKPAKGSDDFEYTWNDSKYLFSCKENLELFKSDPVKYAPQYNGYCAFAMSRGDYSRINPEVYAIVDGKLYLTYNRDIRNAWLQDKEHYISKADRIWQESKFSKR